MTNTNKVLEVDCSTGILTERDMTAEEIASMESARIATEARLQAEAEELAAKAAAKASAQAKLAALGLTADEIAAL